MIEVCDLLEVPAARLAAERRTPQQLDQIREAAAIADRFDDPIERYAGGGTASTAGLPGTSSPTRRSPSPTSVNWASTASCR